MTKRLTCLTRLSLAILPLALLPACVSVPAEPQAAAAAPAPQTIQILALNDFHGNLEPPAGTVRYLAEGAERRDQLGGAARMAATLSALRQGKDHTVTVAAGDLIGASPLVSAYYLDEPAIMALNRMGLDVAAVGNHEFDRGTHELKRMQQGGCETQVTARQACQLDRPFEGARFRFLAANVLDAAGQTLFPGTDLRTYGAARVGFIGMTLKETATLTSPSGTTGYTFADEAQTANRLAAELKGAGADTVVLLIHQGGFTDPYYNADGCPGLTGDILPIVEKLSPAISVVVSGHTHTAYVCELPMAEGGKRLLTSAGRYGYMVTDIALTIDPAADRVLGATARNRPVLAEGGEQPEVAALVARYAEAARPVAQRVVGRIAGALLWPQGISDSTLGNMIADAQLAAARPAAKGGAHVAFINSGGVRTGFTPAADGSVTYGQIFALQPFGNSVAVVEMSGAELRRLLEQQFRPGTPAQVGSSWLIPSQGFSYAFDRNRPDGQRIVSMELDGRAVDPAARYRVAVNNFLASGGDGFSLLAGMPILADAGSDLDALEAHLSGGRDAPAVGRVRDVTAAPATP